MKSFKIKIHEPQTKQKFEAYYLLRYEVLRKPWNQPIGSEKDDLEAVSIHAFAEDNDDRILGVCRMHLNSSTEAQIRFMGVASHAQGLGVGKKLVQYLENKAKEKGIQKIILQSRENAVGFYLKCGYTKMEKTYLMWGEIQHYLMTKELQEDY